MMKRVGEKEKRKVRSDKKKQIRPSLPGTLVAEINSIRKFLGAPSVSSIMEQLMVKTVTDKGFIEHIKPYLYRTIKLPVSRDGTYFITLIANPNNAIFGNDLYLEIKEGITERTSFFISKEISELYLLPLTSGLNVSYDGLATIVMDYAVNYLTFKIAPGYRCKYYARTSGHSQFYGNQVR